MSGLVLRGRTLSFTRKPENGEDHSAYVYEEDGGLWLEDGLIRAAGPFDHVKVEAGDAPVTDHRPHLILPGFIDPHIHYPQMQVLGSYAGSLLEWLNSYTFLEEQRFHDEAHARRIASAFFDELIRHGTTTAVSYCTVHPLSADAFFEEAAKRNLLMAGGKSIMDRQAPEALTDTVQRGYDDTKALIARWQTKGRSEYCITLRFAITSTEAQMEATGALIKEHPELLFQTHLSENHGEIELIRQLFPGHDDYTAVYEHYGMLGPKSLFGHAIHLSEREIASLTESRSVAVSCPTSNLFLGSGLFRRADLEAKGVRTAYATDVGGGTSYSMLRTMDEGYKVAQLVGDRMHPLISFHAITRGNADALSLTHKIGTLEPGTDADLVVLDARAKPEMTVKMERVETLAEELFLLQTVGDDRNVAETYVAGAPMKSALH